MAMSKERKEQYWELRKKLRAEGKMDEFEEMIKQELKEEKESKTFVEKVKEHWVEIVIVLGILTVVSWSALSSMPRFAVHFGRVTQSGDTIRERENAQAVVKELLPIFKLRNGSPMKEPTIVIWGECGEHISARTVTDGNMVFAENSIVICGKAAQHPHDRLVRLMKHEMIHVWIQQSGIQDDSDHGREFMKKALEVGTTIDDQP